MNVRAALIQDVEAIAKISSVLGYPQTSITTATSRLSDIINSNTDKVWVYEIEGQVVGWVHAFLGLRVASASFVEIAGIAVSTTTRNCGIGRSLINCAKLWASELEVDLRVRCNSQRLQTHQFYQKLGFSQIKNQYVFNLSQ